MPGVVTGSQVTLPADGGTYTLYYLFPMTDQEKTLSLVRRALVTGGALLLVLVGGLTWLVTRQVVTPVRLARRVAERLASGRLEERMHVRGDDDIARLGSSFNQMAASLQKQIRQLEELSRVQRRFVSDVSHELRTPLTTVRMAGDVLHDARARFDPPTSRAAELLQKELDRFELLLGDLLEISRFDAGAAVLDLEDVNLVDLAHRVVESTRPLAERRGTTVVIREGARAAIAEVDPRRVERIVRNLVTNAIDYAEGREVVISLESSDDATALAVRDYGVGLRPGESAMVFNRFWRADPARARTTGGTGLGLSISLEDAHLHGGWLQAWGEPGGGAQFRLTLPRRAGDRIGASPLPLVPADAACGHEVDGGCRLRPARPARSRPRCEAAVNRVVPALIGSCLALVLSGCVGLPDSGSVRTVSVQQRGESETLVDYTPGGPRKGTTPVPLVSNFLTAMTATPLNTSVARQFLTSESAESWVPERGTLVYGERRLLSRPDGSVVLELSDVVELDARGGWLGDPTDGQGATYVLELVKERGEWRVSGPPDRLIVPRSHFDAQYQQYFLYFFDKTAQVLVPEPVYVPRGLQAPTLLVAGLLKGPGQDLLGVERTFLPSGTALDGISVPVNRSGVAEVPLSDEVLDVDDTRLNLVFAQLSWTLAQIPTVERMRVTVDGTPLDLPGARSDVAIDEWSEFGPSVAWASTALFGVRDKRVVTVDGGSERRISGPFGALSLAPRSIAVDLPAQHVAGVTPDGRQVLVSDRESVSGREPTPGDARPVYTGGTDVARPVYDLYGQLWVLDRTSAGARFSVVRGDESREVTVPGVSGRSAGTFVLSRDGTRLLTQLGGRGRDRLLVSRVQRDQKGRVRKVGPPTTLPLTTAPTRIRDLGWRAPGSAAVLAGPTDGTAQVLLVPVDGSSEPEDLGTDAVLFRDAAQRLVTSPTSGAPLYVGTSAGELFSLTASGRWTATSVRAGLLAATFTG